jgi:hypothetical protein
MSSTVDPVAEALKKLAKIEAEAYDIKRWINQGCQFSGKPPMFPDLQEPGGTGAVGQLSIAPDQFFGKPFATAVREIMTMWADAAAGKTRPASIDEIHAALVEGGFNFQANDTDRQKQGLAVSLGKNTVTFRKLPSGLFGLAEWYGGGGKTPRRKVIVRGELVDAPMGEDTTQGPHIDDDGLGSNTDLNRDRGDPDEDEAGESPDSDSSPASGPTPYSADEDGREVEHDNMTP